MPKEFLPFSKPSIGPEEIEAVTKVLKSGWITTGPNAAEFEKQLGEYIGCGPGVALTSATAGMHVVLKALNIGPGDEVLTPSLTWVSTVNLIELSGAKPVFVDVDRDTLLISVEDLKRKITPRSKVVIPVHYAGVPADLPAIYELAKQHGLTVIEDSAHAIGTFLNGTHVGKKGTSIFSFHPIKNITSGEGGMITSDDTELLDRVKRLKFHGLGVDAFDRKMQGRSPQAEVVEPGYKYNMPDILAALGLCQLKRIDEFNEKRRVLAERYLELLGGVSELTPLKIPSYDHKHAWHLFIVRVDKGSAGMTRDDFMAALKERQVGTGLHFKAAHVQKYYRERYPEVMGTLPNTEWNSASICSLPLFPDMTIEEVDDVVSVIKDVLVKR